MSHHWSWHLALQKANVFWHLNWPLFEAAQNPLVILRAPLPPKKANSLTGGCDPLHTGSRGADGRSDPVTGEAVVS